MTSFYYTLYVAVDIISNFILHKSNIKLLVMVITTLKTRQVMLLI